MQNQPEVIEMWQWRQSGYISDLMSENDARYWAQRENNRSSSIGNEAEVRRVMVEPWQVQDDDISRVSDAQREQSERR